MLKEFKEFALKGNVLDMAVGIIVGAAFTKVVNSLVADIILPPLGLLTKSSDFVKNWGLKLAIPGVDEQVTVKIGSFLDSLIQFTLVAFAIFLLIRVINRLRAPAPTPAAPVTTRECPYCTSAISLKATRCPFCTSTVTPG